MHVDRAALVLCAPGCLYCSLKRAGHLLSKDFTSSRDQTFLPEPLPPHEGASNRPSLRLVALRQSLLQAMLAGRLLQQQARSRMVHQIRQWGSSLQLQRQRCHRAASAGHTAGPANTNPATCSSKTVRADCTAGPRWEMQGGPWLLRVTPVFQQHHLGLQETHTVWGAANGQPAPGQLPGSNPQLGQAAGLVW